MGYTVQNIFILPDGAKGKTINYTDAHTVAANARVTVDPDTGKVVVGDTTATKASIVVSDNDDINIKSATATNINLITLSDDGVSPGPSLILNWGDVGVLSGPLGGQVSFNAGAGVTDLVTVGSGDILIENIVSGNTITMTDSGGIKINVNGTYISIPAGGNKIVFFGNGSTITFDTNAGTFDVTNVDLLASYVHMTQRFVTIAGFTTQGGIGVGAIVAAGVLLNLNVASTPVCSYTPQSATGQIFRVSWALSCKTTSTPNLKLTYRDPQAGDQIITLYNTAMAGSTTKGGTIDIVAKSGADIAITGTDSVALGDIFASATIEIKSS